LIKAKKSLGQNFLVDGAVTRRILDAVAPKPYDLVFEIGPGRGALTRHLLKRSGLVLAVEIDSRMVEELRNEFRHPNFYLLEADALTVDWETLIDTSILNWRRSFAGNPREPRVRVVANLPYYVATPIVEKMVKLRAHLDDLTLMLQEEVVDRITSKPGSRDYGYLTLLVQYYAIAEKLFRVPPSAFSPPPKVNSAIVRLAIKKSHSILIDDEERFFALIRAAFAQRRKTILNNLKAAPPHLKPVTTLEGALQSAKIEGRRRAETLSLEEFGALYTSMFEVMSLSEIDSTG
jgi:16S rRNA (adenine1518-N6/adenine1519-N6)-dimethyltransferase